MQVITGNKFKALAGGKIYFMSVDDLFESKLRPLTPYVLISHEGDVPADEYTYVLSDPNLIHWYATNSGIKDGRVTAIPVGIEYRLPVKHDLLFNAILGIKQDRSHRVSTDCFALHTWVEERQRCLKALERNGLKMDGRKDYSNYLLSLKKCMFVPCPIGNGIDTFRVWEALYMGCVPIMTTHINEQHIKVKQYEELFYHQLPIYFIDSWDAFRLDDYTPELYNSIMENSSLETLDFDYWKKLILSK